MKPGSLAGAGQSGVLAAAGGLASCQGSSTRQAAASASGAITILHTNDIHGRHWPFRVSPGNATAQTGNPDSTKELNFLSGMCYGVSLEPGPITREMLYTLLPHTSKLVTLELTGAQVLELLEQTATNQNPGDDLAHVGGLLQTIGLDWLANLNLPVGQRVRGVQVNGQPLDSQRHYRVVTHNGILSSIHLYTTFAQGQKINKLDKGMIEVAESGLPQRSFISSPVLARVLVVPAK